MLFLMCNVQT